MADYTRRERTQTFIEYSVPVFADHGCAVAEVFKALAAAEQDVKRLKGEDALRWDDWCRLVPTDEAIVIRIEVTPRG